MKNILNEKLGIDTNILVYIIDQHSSYFKIVKPMMERVIIEKTPLFICQQNIIEAENTLVKAYHLKSEIAVEKVMNFIESFQITIIHPIPTTITLYHKLLVNYKKTELFDLFLAATYLDNNIHRLLTANTKDFNEIPEFKAISPSELFRSTKGKI